MRPFPFSRPGGDIFPGEIPHPRIIRLLGVLLPPFSFFCAVPPFCFTLQRFGMGAIQIFILWKGITLSLRELILSFWNCFWISLLLKPIRQNVNFWESISLFDFDRPVIYPLNSPFSIFSNFLIRFCTFCLSFLFLWNWITSSPFPNQRHFGIFQIAHIPFACVRNRPLVATTFQFLSIPRFNFGPLTSRKGVPHFRKSVSNCVSRVRNNRFGISHFAH